ncbi:nucleotidyltransferase [Vulcanisaeta souniana JCM 11219]|uniref:Nucleotidyltransferase n=1 Tax=Vulcanisaeta souniana JCM 11219 TaxID=1293586 RepID=A0A830E3Q9_9CREN|nr:nucleotidyltransferase [Vulcanisaeta souniana]BDR93296.1 nucleotidyltransferase [Vulcanisaeta souniana JCM 11219]GGI79024.1 nucleotidyltransferase [Vulcanisaeta souniana JCM 11219]
MTNNQLRETLELIKKALVKVGTELSKRGIDFMLIGSAVLPLLYGVNWNVHDIDIFIINKSTVTEPELFEEIAKDNDWDVGMDMNGMMYYEVLVDAQVVRVDLMENLLDIYIPEAMISKSLRIKVNGLEIRSIRLEDLLVLKAREASEEGDEFLSRIAEMLADPESKLNIDRKYLREAINYYPDDKDAIERRLEKSGIYLE